MPALPTMTISDQVAWDRVFGVFHGSAAEYRTWLLNALRDEVQSREADAIREQADNQVRVKLDEVNNMMQPNKVTWSTPRGAKTLSEDVPEETSSRRGAPKPPRGNEE